MLHSTADEHTTTNCTVWDAWETWTPTIKQNFMTFAMSNMDALQASYLIVHSFIIRTEICCPSVR
jgi:hypothetical protein